MSLKEEAMPSEDETASPQTMSIYEEITDTESETPQTMSLQEPTYYTEETTEFQEESGDPLEEAVVALAEADGETYVWAHYFKCCQCGKEIARILEIDACDVCRHVQCPTCGLSAKYAKKKDLMQ